RGAGLRRVDDRQILARAVVTSASTVHLVLRAADRVCRQWDVGIRPWDSRAARVGHRPLRFG
ncbi:hypothetical protein M5W98_30315, partial [Paenibacillus apiarius]|nr:hypothetical protein [Paenibacillus apiarius]